MLRYALGRPAFRAKLRRPSTLPPHLRSTSRLWVHLKLPGTRGHFGTPRLRLTNFDQEINAVGKKAQRYGVRDWDWRLPTKNRIDNDCCASRGEISPECCLHLCEFGTFERTLSWLPKRPCKVKLRLALEVGSGMPSRTANALDAIAPRRLWRRGPDARHGAVDQI
jgi:hypothetical protein